MSCRRPRPCRISFWSRIPALTLCALIPGALVGPRPAWPLTGTWSVITADDNSVGRDGPSAVFDPRRGEFSIVGGLVSHVCTGGYVSVSYPSPLLTHAATADVPWALHSTTGYNPIALAAGVDDPVADRLWLFGGSWYDESTRISYASRALQMFDLATGNCSVPTPTGVVMPRLSRPQMVLDPARRRLLVLGGVDSTGVPIGGIWSMSLSSPGNWTTLAATGTAPPARYGGFAVYDPDSDRVLVGGGIGATAQPLSDLWSLDLKSSAAWRSLASGGTPPLGWAWGVLDRATHQLVVLDSSTTGVRSLDLASRQWSAVVTSGGAPTVGNNILSHDASVAFDPVTRRLVWAWPTVGMVWCGGAMYADTYVLTLGPATSAGVGPPSGTTGLSLGPPRPAPARTWFALPVTLPDDTPCRLEGFDVAGRHCWQQTVQGAGAHTVWIDARSFAPGVAFIRARAGTSSQVRHIAIVH